VKPVRALSVDEIQLGDVNFWLRPQAEREGAFATLREERPVSFHQEPEFPLLPKGPGFWALTRHADILHASRTPELFCSGRGTQIGDQP
jgi:cytochrome P450